MQKTVYHQHEPFQVPTVDGKTILEHFGGASTGDSDVSIAHMIAPGGWSEPPQTPEFGEFTLMVAGQKQIELPTGPIVLSAGESLFVPAGTRVRYANPFEEPAVYWSVCIPAFNPNTVHRETET